MRLLLFSIALLSFQLAFSQGQKNLKKGDLAVEGYDVVAYFNGEPKEGSTKFQSMFKGARYQFSSKLNKEQFLSNPDMYVPQYGGWCAYAMGIDGSKVKIDPETFKIIDNKLYLFYNFWGTNTLESWNEKETALKASADQYWRVIVE